MALKYAVVDIETTGNHIETDHIIQIGIAIVQNNRISAQYDTFIHTQVEIPSFIRTLTQIEQNDVMHAPSFFAVKDEIYQLLNGCVFVAHNVEFDLKFLQKYFQDVGINYEPKYIIDTVDLIKMLYPTLRSYQLKQISDALFIPLNNAHRAIDDAIATANVFIRCIDKLSHMPIDTLKQIYPIAKKMRYDVNELIFEVIITGTTVPINIKKHGQFYVFNEQIEPFEFEWLDSFEAFYQLVISKCQLEYRKQQFELSERFLNQMYVGGELAIEADLGSGKSLSYLIAAIYFLVVKKENVLISTSTIVLQHQLIYQEIKRINNALNIKIPIQLIKSKKHYLSLEFVSFLLNDSKDNHDSMLLKIQLLVFILESDGDIEKLNLNGGRKIYFELMQVLFNKKQTHYLMPPKQALCIGITNHAHIVSSHHETLFEPFKHLIVDEAHQLLNYFLNNTVTEISYERTKYYLSQIQKNIEIEMTSNQKMNLKKLQHYQKALLDFKWVNEQFDLLIDQLMTRKKEAYQMAYSFEIVQSLQEMYLVFKQYQLLDLNDFITNILKQLMENFDGLLTSLNLNQNVYVEALDFNKSKFKFIYESILIKQLIANQLHRYQSISFTSGTLLSLAPLLNQLQLINCTVEKIESNHKKIANCFIPTDLPPYEYENQTHYFENVLNYIVYFLQTQSSKTLILVNSYTQVEMVKRYLQDILDESVILAQTKNTQTSKLNQQFKALDQCILIGTQSFYEGIDFQFHGFKCVMILTLPFMHKDDIRPQLLHNELKNPFMDYFLPVAVNTFEQATGRLIRHIDDEGLLICFDNRLINANYKQRFMDKLTKFNVIQGDMKQFEQLLQNYNEIS